VRAVEAAPRRRRVRPLDVIVQPDALRCTKLLLVSFIAINRDKAPHSANSDTWLSLQST